MAATEAPTTRAARERRVPVERLLVDDRVRAVIGGPVGRVTSTANGWTIVEYRTRSPRGRLRPRSHQLAKSLVPYQHGLEQLMLVSSPRRHDARHPGNAEGCTHCWTMIVGDSNPVRYKRLPQSVNLDPGDSLNTTLHLSIDNGTGERLRVIGFEYGPVRFVTEDEQ